MLPSSVGMRAAPWPPFSLAIAVSLAAGIVLYPARNLPPQRRRILTGALIVCALASPLLIPSSARFPRLLASVFAVLISCRLYDAERSGRFASSPLRHAVEATDSFALVMRRVLVERTPSRRNDLVQLPVGAIAGAAAILLTDRVFRVNWSAHAFFAEHCAKVVSLFLVIRFLPNSLAAGYRLAGFPATDFAGEFFAARTPAEFWRRYNRPAERFFAEYVFQPLGGIRRPMLAMFGTFAFSGLVHEYVFDIAVGRIVGTQMLFFLIQGLAVLPTARLRPRGAAAIAGVALTLLFNLLTAVLFFSAMNAVIPFYVRRP